MKKALFITTLMICVIFLISCTFEINTPQEKNDSDFDMPELNLSEGNQTFQESETPQNDQTSIPEITSTEASNSNYEWKEFLADYEAWVDDYVAFMKKYKANPTDFSLLTDYAKMSAKAIEWSNKASDMQENLSPTELTEYMQTLSRITQKLTSIA